MYVLFCSQQSLTKINKKKGGGLEGGGVVGSVLILD
jgi:hypothetical protein